MYDKLAGMTGTALTEATEFMKIYKLPVVQIPTNRPMVRADRNDQVYKTKDGKWARGRRARSRSATRRASRSSSARSPSRSPSCSPTALRKRGIPHTVLNAKPEHAEREGEIVAEAGRPGAVTIATNMAGRGVDIKLGGNAEHLTAARAAPSSACQPGDPDYDERFAEILPDDRGASRRTARRSWRPAACSSAAPSATSRAGSTTSCAAAPAARATRASRASSSPPRTTSCACSPATGSTGSSTASAPIDEEGNEEPIEARMLSKQIEKAQRKVEEQNFLIRKRVLEYDDVMNEQREIVYAVPRRGARGPRHGPDRARADRRASSAASSTSTRAGDYVEDWDLDGAVHRARPDLPGRLRRPSELDRRSSTARSSSSCSSRTR